MAAPPYRPEVIIVGAGAAGIGAARTLGRRGISCLVLEAASRIGGRAHTRAFGPHRLDLGCEWLHSADLNALADLAPSFGVALDKSTPPWQRRTAQPRFDADDQHRFDVEQNAFYKRLEAAGELALLTGIDEPASHCLDPTARWNGLLDAISTYYNGAPLDRVSSLDFYRYIDTEVNWRAAGGYGALIASIGAEIPLRLDCAVTRIAADGRAVIVSTPHGDLAADAVIVTVSTDVLVSGAIAFDGKADAHLDAAAGLPLGLADKVFFSLADAEDFEPDTRLIGRPGVRDSGSYTIRPRGTPLLEGYFAGDHARALEKEGPHAFFAVARAEIAELLGPDVARNLTPIVATAWAGEPLARGSYSHALPGRAGGRAQLAEPIDDRLYFAGEATSSTFFSTAHGAYEEGCRVAELIASARH